MADDKDRAKQPGGSTKTARDERLKQQLRQNLSRRKAQSRARRAGDADETEGLPAAGDDEKTKG